MYSRPRAHYQRATRLALNDVHVLLVSDYLWRRSRWLAAVQQGHTRGYCSPTSTIRHWVFYLVCMHCRCPAERHGYFIPALACREAWLFHSSPGLLRGMGYFIPALACREAWLFHSSLGLQRGMVINPRRACAARVTVVVLCVCVFVCPGRSSATHATKRQTRYTHGFSILLAPE